VFYKFGSSVVDVLYAPYRIHAQRRYGIFLLSGQELTIDGTQLDLYEMVILCWVPNEPEQQPVVWASPWNNNRRWLSPRPPTPTLPARHPQWGNHTNLLLLKSVCINSRRMDNRGWVPCSLKQAICDLYNTILLQEEGKAKWSKVHYTYYTLQVIAGRT